MWWDMVKVAIGLSLLACKSPGSHIYLIPAEVVSTTAISVILPQPQRASKPFLLLDEGPSPNHLKISGIDQPLIDRGRWWFVGGRSRV